MIRTQRRHGKSNILPGRGGETSRKLFSSTESNGASLARGERLFERCKVLSTTDVDRETICSENSVQAYQTTNSLKTATHDRRASHRSHNGATLFTHRTDPTKKRPRKQHTNHRRGSKISLVRTPATNPRPGRATKLHSLLCLSCPILSVLTCLVCLNLSRVMSCLTWTSFSERMSSMCAGLDMYAAEDKEATGREETTDGPAQHRFMISSEASREGRRRRRVTGRSGWTGGARSRTHVSKMEIRQQRKSKNYTKK